MKFLTIVAAIVALRALAAHSPYPRPGDAPKKQEQKPQVDEKAYKAALDRIPEPKEKYDPWGAARPAEPAKKK